MNSIDLVEMGHWFAERDDIPTTLFDDGHHAIYWLGTPGNSAFRCNAYMILDGNDAVLVDPGGVDAFKFVKDRVEQIIQPEKIAGLILSHPDPDVAASMVNWLDVNPAMEIITSVRTNILLPHYGRSDYSFYNINDHPTWTFPSGRKLSFIESPFLHFPGAFATFDESSGFLFSGDIWASIDVNWHLVVDDFEHHELKLNLFHLDYMASNVATRGFVNRIRHLPLEAILPQHGSVIPKKFIPAALKYLAELRCGLDLIYPG